MGSSFQYRGQFGRALPGLSGAATSAVSSVCGASQLTTRPSQAARAPQIQLRKLTTAEAGNNPLAARCRVIPPCLQCDRINIVPPERVRKFCFTSADKLAKERTRSAISGIDLQLLSGFGILQRDDADIRQYPFSFVFNVDGYEIVPPSAHS